MSLYGATIVSAATPEGTPGEAGMPSVARPRAGLGEQRVGVAVVAARELEDPVAREGAREAERAHRRLGPGRDEPHLLDRRHGVDDLGGQLDLGLGRGAEARPASAASRTASTVSGSACPKRSGPHDITQSR